MMTNGTVKIRFVFTLDVIRRYNENASVLLLLGRWKSPDRIQFEVVSPEFIAEETNARRQLQEHTPLSDPW